MELKMIIYVPLLNALSPEEANTEMKVFCKLPPLMPRYIFVEFPTRDCRL